MSYGRVLAAGTLRSVDGAVVRHPAELVRGELDGKTRPPHPNPLSKGRGSRAMRVEGHRFTSVVPEARTSHVVTISPVAACFA